MKESNIQRQIQIDASADEVLLMRNNIGAYTTDAGHRIAFGVGGPGGSDLVGGTPLEITQDMVGSTVCVLTVIEVKTEKGKPTEQQKNFISAIIARHGIAGVARSYGDVRNLIQQFKSRISRK